jgi:hypothetical protein
MTKDRGQRIEKVISIPSVQPLTGITDNEKAEYKGVSLTKVSLILHRNTCSESIIELVVIADAKRKRDG